MKRLMCLVSDYASAQMLRWLLPDLLRNFEKVGVWIWSYDRMLAARERQAIGEIASGVEWLKPLHETARPARGLRRLWKEKRACLQALRWRPDAVLQFHHAPDDISSFLERVASGKGIPVWLLPAIKPDPLVERTLMADRRPLHVCGPQNRAIANLIPRWATAIGEQAVLRLPGPKIVALEVMRLAPPEPWTQHWGDFAGILLESRRQVEAYLSIGFPPGQLRETGTPVFDRLFAARSKPRQAGEKPVALTLVPPDQYPSGVPGSRHGGYEALLRDWMEGLAVLSRRFTIRLAAHPRMGAASVLPHLGPGMTMTDGAIVDEIAGADLLIGAASNALAWGIALGIPVLDYNTYGLGSGRYCDAPGLIYADSMQSWRSATLLLSTNDGWKAAQDAVSAEARRAWGIVDGRACERICRTIREDLPPQEIAHAPAHMPR